jgi:tRNA modification GTPase
MANVDFEDIICAPATVPGTGAIALIRVSGKGSLECADRVISLMCGTLSQAKGYSLHYGVVRDGEDTLDEVLVSVFRAPLSYTGEDSVEISCHASEYITSEILHRLCEQGARLAGPGEFTRRAYLHGKMDLSQAEAVADVIAADSRTALRVAQRQLRGDYSKAFRELRDELVTLSSLLELELDFSEEEVEFANRDRLRTLAEGAIRKMTSLKESYRVGGSLKRGIPVAIVGAPNAGKSTLLNALLGQERAIVSDIPGTTRDTIEETIVIKGVKYRFIDTAGIRDTKEKIESLGIERSLTKARKAAIVICLLDTTSPTESEAVLGQLMPILNLSEQKLLVVENKTDLTGTEPVMGDGCPDRLIRISALKKDGLDDLLAAIDGCGLAKKAESEVIMTSERHYRAICDALESMQALLAALRSGISVELVAEDLRAAIRAVNSIFASISDSITPDEVLGEVFGQFCIGK